MYMNVFLVSLFIMLLPTNTFSAYKRLVSNMAMAIFSEMTTGKNIKSSIMLSSSVEINSKNTIEKTMISGIQSKLFLI